jgi:hypothetical protein
MSPDGSLSYARTLAVGAPFALAALLVACGGCPPAGVSGGVGATDLPPTRSTGPDAPPAQQTADSGAQPADPSQSPRTTDQQAQVVDPVQQDVDTRCPERALKNLAVHREACPLGVWIGESATGVCPPAGEGWTARALFPTADSAAGGSARPAAPFCAYEWVGDAQPDLCALPGASPTYAQPAGEWLDRDCRVVAPVAGLQPVLAEFASARLTETLRRLEVPPIKAAPLLATVPAGPDSPAAAVSSLPIVAIVDTAPPTDEANPLESAYHGLAVHGVARAVACQTDQGACLAEFERFQGLRPSGDASVAFAYQATGLVQAIEEATRRWRAAKTESKNARPGMVLNLSVGWDEAFTWRDGTAPSDRRERASAKAVRLALRDAACAGILVFAAAGNPAVGRGASAGPVYPAAWEGTPMPTQPQCKCLAECATRAQCAECDAIAGVGEPLVYAVGALDDADNELIGARAAGMPRLAAPGYLIAAPMPSSGTFAITEADPLRLPVMTGTSMSTAIVSAVAAAVWRTNPKLAPHQVVEILRESSETLRITADFCQRGLSPCGPTGRVSFCRAVAAAGRFASASEAAELGPQRREFAATCTQSRNSAGTPTSAAALSPAVRSALGALPDAQTREYAGANPAESPSLDTAAPEGEEPMTRPWIIAPQPSRNPCSACEIVGASGTLTMFTSDWLTAATNVRNTTLTVSYARGTYQVFSLDAAVGSPVGASHTYSVSRLNLGTGINGATLSWLATEGGQTVSISTQIGFSE